MRIANATFWLSTFLGIFSPAVIWSADNPFSIIIATRQDIVKVGSEIRISILLKNTSDQIISILRSPAEDIGEVFNEVEMRDADGKPVPETKYSAS